MACMDSQDRYREERGMNMAYYIQDADMLQARADFFNCTDIGFQEKRRKKRELAEAMRNIGFI